MAPTSTPAADSLGDIHRELTERLHRGEELSLADWQERHPEHADELRRIFQKTVHLRPHPVAPQASRGPIAEEPLRQVGDYDLLREVGRGGMGVVYEAQQRSLGRRVAVKILPPHAVQDSAQARFRREASAAARLHHTNIVPIYEVGQDAGVCYYAMQFIDGQGLDARIAELQASPPAAAQAREHYRTVARLGEQVADALAYAHARGIVHRDIKPSNLLLDAGGIVWITDFGLAKSLDDDATAPGDVIGTLRYMAPERFRGQGDQRVDIYALGLTLYELAVLRAPYASSDHVQLMDEVQHREPPRPRAVDARLPRDLETIILKAIDKDPARRYQTAAELAADLRRFAADEPIQARPIGGLEKLLRAARRNPKPAVLTALVVVLVVTLVVGALASALSFRDLAEQERVQANLARRAERDAHTARTKAEAETDRANRQTETAQEIATFVLGLLEETDPIAFFSAARRRKAGDQRLTPLQMLDQAATKLKTSLLDKTAVRAALLDKIGTVYVGFGKFAQAKPLLDEALALRQQLHAGDHADLAESWLHQGYEHHAQSRRREAEAAYAKALDMRRRLFGEDHPLVAEALIHYGFVRILDDSARDAEAMLEQARAIQARHFGKNSRQYGVALLALLQWHFRKHELDKVMPLLAEGEALLKHLGEDDLPVAAIHCFMQAQLARQLRQPQQCVELCRKGLGLAEAWFGETHFFVLLARKELAYVHYEDLRDFAAAEKEFRIILERLERINEQESADGGSCLMHLGRILRDQKRYDEAAAVVSRAAAVMRKEGGDLGRCLHIHGERLYKGGRVAEAVPALAEACVVRKARCGDDQLWHARVLDYYVSIVQQTGDQAAVVKALREHAPSLDRHARPDAAWHMQQAERRAPLCALLADQPDEAAFVDATRAKGMESLRLAVAAGFRDARALRTRPTLAPLRTLPEFGELLKSVEATR